MLDASVNDFIESFSPGDDVVFVVSGNERADLSSVRSAPDQQAKIAALKKVTAAVKKPYLQLFERYRDDGLRVINKMEGSDMFIVCGRPDSWRKFVTEQKNILDAQNLVLIPNQELASID